MRDSAQIVNGEFRGKFGRNSWFEDAMSQMIGAKLEFRRFADYEFSTT
jgi:hypothetical protein